MADPSHWERVFDRLYAAEAAAPPDGFDLRGWVSEFTGGPISPDVFARWLDAVVERILSLAPRRVLEIGGGTGNVALRVAPLAEHYISTDISDRACAALSRRSADAGLAGRVESLRATAIEALGLAADVDTVVLNSVVQYFPDQGYAEEVLKRACTLVGQDGAVFVGDVCSRPLFPTRMAVIESLSGERSLEDRRHRWSKRVSTHSELSLAPSFFRRIARSVGGRVALCMLKPQLGDTELTAYRYDAVLMPVPAGAPPAVCRLDQLTLDKVGRGHDADVLWVQDVGNPRLVEHRRMHSALVGSHAPRTPGDMIDPDAWVGIAAVLGRQALPVWDEDTEDGRYSVLMPKSAASSTTLDGDGTIRRALAS